MGAARVGDVLPSRAIRTGRARRLEATAFVIPGSADLSSYLRALDGRAEDFIGWDGRVVTLTAGPGDHQVVVTDRYGQVWESTRASDESGLPTADALEAWFRFLAIACPECGVLDDPRPRDWTP